MEEEIAKKLSRNPDSHKGQNGKVLVIGGSRDYTGAPSLASKAALRTGADLVKIFCPETIQDIVAGYSENFILETYDADYLESKCVQRALEMTEWADSTVIGPGLGNSENEAVSEILNHSESPIVVDADALKSVPRSSVNDAVLTPHSGEMKALLDNIQSLKIILNRNVAVIEKGPKDLVHTSEGKKKIEVGAPVMTVGGTGDTLAGIAGGLLAQGIETDDAVKLSAWINGKAGEKAAEQKGVGMLATDLIEQIPNVLRSTGDSTNLAT